MCKGGMVDPYGRLLKLLEDILGSIWLTSLDKLKEESQRRKGNKW
jgi:hypothetical protein